MKTLFPLFLLLAGLADLTAPAAQTYVTPMMGGGQVAADMVHIDLYYDEFSNVFHATVDDSYGTPELRALAPGYAFDPQAVYAVLNGKAYNFQYGWNVGGFFTLPPGSKIWIERIDGSPGLETYEEYSYTPVFGTGGSPRLWRWDGSMVHNVYAVRNPPIRRLFVEYHVFIGDEHTGSRANFMDYDDTTVRLEWTVVPVENAMTFQFGAVGQTNDAPLCFLNAARFATNSLAVVNLRYTNAGPCALQYACSIPMMVVPATTGNGGPATNPAALGAHLELQLVSLAGPPQAGLSFWEAEQTLPSFSLPTGEAAGTNCIVVSENCGAPGTDPYGCIQGRRLAVDRPGLYCLGFRLVDTSTNGLAGGPIHAPSPLYCLYLQADVTIASLTRLGASVTAWYGGEPGWSFSLQRSLALGAAASWQTVAGPLAGTNRLQSLTASAATNSRSFFRLRVQ